MLKKLLAAGALGLLLTATPQTNAQTAEPAGPSNSNEVSTFTITEPIEVAGTIIQPGTYLIRVINQTGGETYNRNVIQITSEDMAKIYVTAAANPRPAQTDPAGPRPLFEYYEASANVPKALRTWYPAGTKTGRDIVYPRSRALVIAEASRSTVTSVSDETKEAELSTADLTPIEAPAETTAELTTPEPAPVVAESAPAEARAELPTTASPEPLFAGLGFLALGGAFGLRLLSRRVG